MPFISSSYGGKGGGIFSLGTFPGQPRFLTSTPTNGQLSIAFTAPSFDGGVPITTYQYSTDGGSTWQNRQTGTTASPLVITGLSNGQNYSVALRAVNPIGAGGSASVPTGIQSLDTTPFTVPSAVGTITYVAGDNGDKFTWVAPASNGRGITKYRNFC